MVFLGKVRSFTGVEDEARANSIVLFAKSYKEAAGKIEDVYGNDLIEINNLFCLDGDDSGILEITEGEYGALLDRGIYL